MLVMTGAMSGGIALGQVSSPTEDDDVWLGPGADGPGVEPAPGLGVGGDAVGGAFVGGAGGVVPGVTA